MKLVRLDGIAAGGRPLELHPRLTIVRGGGPRLRDALVASFRSLGTGVPPPHGGVIEVNGVQLALDAATVEQLDLDLVVDPVMVFSEPSGTTASVPLGPAGTQDGSGDVTAQLGVVAVQLADVAARIEAARQRLDPFAAAALETVLGRIEALERTRASRRAEWEARRQSLEARRRTLTDELRSLRANHAIATSIDPAPVLAARAALVQLSAAPTEPEPEAGALADLLDAAHQRLRDLQGRRSQLEIRISEAEQRLADARREIDRASDSLHAPRVDAELVERLEAVRDEIFAVDERSGRLGSGRNKRRLQELRAEQAILLEQLGYDTYSAYVMGIPSNRAEMERTSQVEAAHVQLERVLEELEELRASAPGPEELERAEAELQTLLVRAHRHLGPEPAPPVPLDVGSPTASDAVYQIVAALRRRRLAAPGEDDPAVRAAVDELRRCLVTPAWEAVEVLDTPPPPPPPPSAPTRQGLLDASDRWLAWHREVTDWVAGVEERLTSIESQLAELASDPGEPEVAQWAEVEHDLDEALDALAEAEERVRSHTEATEELAGLRDRELELRAAERELLAQRAAAEHVRAERARAGGQANEPVATGAGPPPYRGSPGAREVDQDQLEWSLVARAARQRRLSFVGSLPMLVIDHEGVAAEPTCTRLVRLSELVQVVVVTDDDDLVGWFAGSSNAAAVLDLGRDRR